MNFIDYDIPYEQWFILLIYVFMSSVNYMFRLDKIVNKPSFEDPMIEKQYHSTSEYN